MPFYSIAVYRGKDGRHAGDAAYNLLMSPNRETADRFYRFLQTYPDIYNNKYNFNKLESLSAQVWTFQSNDQDDLRELVRHMCSRDFTISDARFQSIVGSVVLHQFNSNTWFNNTYIPIVQDVNLAAHLNNGEFFIRRKRYPSQFWYLDNKWIRVSDTERTKFRIELKEDGTQTLGTPLFISSDQVRIIAVGSSSTTMIKSAKDGYVGKDGEISTFNFGAFNQGFGVRYNSGDKSDHITYTDSGRLLGEEWELV
ncbi:hypothetical protein Asppvi_000637 [Aspergillus pseudoviridinutans]|uniref:Uncharacterized protein n=1 Tax=Aspergillus pseudoviridinutans TaxID=1517512 RepID=A0A9P3EPA5_9EURO|nr:uncharacterized protein Asppvi_000637 [Aspergillus pseudoviridinutans]GIJ82134.1 hypothetical protein Asppvi_000637 [Aspergillus pseudoviridinutans]